MIHLVSGIQRKMKEIMKIYNGFDIVIVPFPFTDRTSSKRRPALILSQEDTFNKIARHSVMVMITSAKHSTWPLDIAISEYKKAGLPNPSIIRMKFFTLDNRLIIRKIGKLFIKDQKSVQSVLRKLFPLK